MASIYNNMEKRHLGFKQWLNKKLLALTYFKFFGWMASGLTIFILIVIVLFKDNYFFHDGILTDYYNLLMRDATSIFKESNIKMIYSETYKSKILFDDKYVSKITTVFYTDLILSFLKILGYFFVSFFIITRFSNKKIDDAVKEIHEDKVLKGTKILANNEYIKKLKELGEYEPDGDDNYITLSGVYERELIKKGGE